MARSFDDLVFRAALGRFATGVIVLSTGPRPTPHAMTANAFMSGSLEPPLVVVSVGKKARMHRRLVTARRFGISILDQAQEPASRHFAGQPVTGFTPAFGEVAGVPVLADAAVAMAARIKHRYGCGDHTLYVGEVERLVVSAAAPPLLYYAGRYATVEAAREAPGQTYPSFF
jgi:flavin reductase (DIM6/NTAB) family NADH-FMN oxidoreductase RutF